MPRVDRGAQRTEQHENEDDQVDDALGPDVVVRWHADLVVRRAPVTKLGRLRDHIAHLIQPKPRHVTCSTPWKARWQPSQVREEAMEGEAEAEVSCGEY